MVKNEFWREQPALDAIRVVKLCGCDCMVEVIKLYKVNNLYWRTSLKHQTNCHMDIDAYFTPKDTDD